MNLINRKDLADNKGFTLLELMVVLFIIAILVAIAIPSYQTFIKRAAESKAQVAISNIANDLDNWKSKSLSYRGYKADYLLDDKTRYVPNGTNSTNFDYKLTLTDKTSNTKLSDATSNGRFWQILAVPNTAKSSLKYARKLYMDSIGTQCAVANTISSVDCTANAAERW